MSSSIRVAPTCLIGLLVACAPGGTPDDSAPPGPTTSAADTAYVVRAGQLLDISTMSVDLDVALVVRHGVIAERAPYDPEVALMPGVPVLDLSGHTVMAGLIDSHVHLTLGGPADRNALRTVEAGFTTVVDLGSSDHAALALRDAIGSGAMVGPTIIAAGSWIGGRNGVCEFGGATVNGSEEAREQARVDIAAGSDLLKLCLTNWYDVAIQRPDSVELTHGELEAVRAEAEGGVPLVAHAIGRRGAMTAVEFGVRFLAHTPLVDMPAAFHFAAREVCVASTLSTVPEGATRLAADSALLRLRDAGVRIVVGTDAGVLEHGSNAVELTALHELGLSTAEVLRAATRSAAACLGLPDGYGDLRPGSEASFISLRGDPLEDVRLLEDPAVVVARGRVVVDGR